MRRHHGVSRACQARTANLREGPKWVGDRAQRPRHRPGVEEIVREWEPLGRGLDEAHGTPDLPHATAAKPPQLGGWIHGVDVAHVGSVKRQIQARAEARLEDAA